MNTIFCRHFPLIAILLLGSCASNKSSVKGFGGSWKPAEIEVFVDDAGFSDGDKNVAERCKNPMGSGMVLHGQKGNSSIPFVAEYRRENRTVLWFNTGNKSEKSNRIIPLKAVKKFTKNSVSDEGSNQVVALLLCAFIGIMGIHRFYLGYYFIGVVQLLTLGGFGIWYIIDLIRIILGTLKPKHGEYTETLTDMSKKKPDTEAPKQTY